MRAATLHAYRAEPAYSRLAWQQRARCRGRRQLKASGNIFTLAQIRVAARSRGRCHS
jgi:hypothetical protein